MNTDKYLSFHYCEPFIDFLNENSDTFVSFKELAGTTNPWEINDSSFPVMQDRMVEIEEQICGKTNSSDFNCILSEKGVYWLKDESMGKFVTHFEEYVSDVPKSIPLPMWRLSAAEMVCCQVKNLRLLIISLARDMNLLDKYHNRVNGDYKEIRRDFIRLEKNLILMLNEFTELRPTLKKILNKGVDIFDRTLITMDMFEKDEITEETIGYSQMELVAAQEVIERRIKAVNPAFHYQLKSVKSVMKKEIHECESFHLHRTSQWEFIIETMVDDQSEFSYELKIHSLERQVFTKIIQDREIEIGVSPHGQTALSISKRAETCKQQGQKIDEELSSGQPDSQGVDNDTQNESSTNKQSNDDLSSLERSPSKKPYVSRMAFANRRGSR